MAEMTRNAKILHFVFGLAVLVAILGGSFFYFKTGRNLRDETPVEAEVIADGAGSKLSLAGVLRDRATEESVKKDAGELEVNADTSEAAVEETQAEIPEEADTPVADLPPEPENITPAAGELKIGFVTDIHARSNSDGVEGRALKIFFRDGINYFLEQMNQKFKPDFIVANGDIIEGTNRSSDIGKSELSTVKNLFDRTAVPKYWVVGNHDLRSVKKSQWKKSLGIDYLYEAFEVGGYKIIILDSNFTAEDEDIKPDVYNTRGRVSEEELAWLEKELDATGKYVVVFIHHPPLWNVDLRGNGSMPGNAPTLQEIFSRRKVLAVFAGHFEDLFVNESGGVKYFVLPGFIKNEKYQKTFSEITLRNGEIIIDMTYLADEKNYQTVRITE